MPSLNLKFVYGTLSPTEKESVIHMWTTARVVPLQEAIKRVEQVSSLILYNDEIVGVSTVYTDDLSKVGDTYFFSRMFIKEAYRGSNTLRAKVLQLNFHELKKRYEQQTNGLVLELENIKLARLGENTNYMQKRGYTYYGKSQRGLQLWYVRFDEPKGIFKMDNITE
ncbi:MAG: hypothetical protein FP820_08715 [Sulfurimonas sp.]|nr:hypothetical protein [Sulfurimonas sp.]MBU1217915.1 hypothetical protein [bacterium]MBU1434179.1 hypothetical protein [bacterium]MBU1504274.1 hypothetical protein [bacterium]MBU3938780.1 hypothetical protein [bacterium]